MRKLVIICAIIAFLSVNYAVASNWTSFDYPGAMETYANDIDGSNIVGQYRDANGPPLPHGFLYSITAQTWTTLDMPGTSIINPLGISGSNIIGWYPDNYGSNFIYDGATYTTFFIPLGAKSDLSGIDGDNYVASYGNYNNISHGAFYNGTGWTTFDSPGSESTRPSGIEGSNIVGSYRDTNGQYHGFLYNITAQTWTTLDMPGAPEVTMWPRGISGSSIVGSYRVNSNERGFLYDITAQTWTTLDMPGARETIPTGIDGDYIVGWYSGANGYSSFIYTIPDPIPEPATLALLGLGGLILVRRRKSRDEEIKFIRVQQT